MCGRGASVVAVESPPLQFSLRSMQLLATVDTSPPFPAGAKDTSWSELSWSSMSWVAF